MKRALLIIAAIAALYLVMSCAIVKPVTIDECISNFMSDVNNDHSSVYKNLSTSSVKYAQAVPAAYWDIVFPPGYSYALSGQSTAGSTVTASLSGGSLYPGSNIVFTMTQNLDKDYVISSITIASISYFN